MKGERRGRLVRVAFVLVLICLSYLSVERAYGQEIQDPTIDEQNFYDTIKSRYTANKGLGPISVDEIMSTESNLVLVASKDCPDGSVVDRVEIYMSFRLVRWNEAIGGGHGASYFGGPETVITTVESGVKNITYLMYVMFDANFGASQEGDRIGRWDNARLFYHEMLHGQLMIDRMKDPNWEGWESACQCRTPSPMYYAAGDHATIEPAEDAFLVGALETNENIQVLTLRVTGVAGGRDEEGNRPFEETRPIPPQILEKEKRTITVIYKNVVEIQYEQVDNNIVVRGKVPDDRTATIHVIFDPPDVGFILYLTIQSPQPVVGGEVLRVNSFEVFLSNFWIFVLILPVVLYLFYGKRLRHLPAKQVCI